MRPSSDYDYDPNHWKFARTLPRLPYKAPRRLELGAWLPLIAVLVALVLTVRWLP